MARSGPERVSFASGLWAGARAPTGSDERGTVDLAEGRDGGGRHEVEFGAEVFERLAHPVRRGDRATVHSPTADAHRWIAGGQSPVNVAFTAARSSDAGCVGTEGRWQNTPAV